MSILWIACGAFIILFGGGFWWGWFVRGWEVKRLRKDYKKLIDHALQSGWVVSQEELIKNLFEVGIYTPDIPAVFSNAVSLEQSKRNLLDSVERVKASRSPGCPQCHEGRISQFTGMCSECDYKMAVLPFPNYGKDEK